MLDVDFVVDYKLFYHKITIIYIHIYIIGVESLIVALHFLPTFLFDGDQEPFASHKRLRRLDSPNPLGTLEARVASFVGWAWNSFVML